MVKGKLISVGSVLWLILIFGSWVGAVTQLDTTFGEDGFALQDFGIGDDEVFSLAVQSDGKIIAAGYSSNGAVKNLAVVRFLEDGTKDVDFSDDGLLTLSLGNGDTVGRSILIQEDGKIILAGSVQGDTDHIVVIRLTPEGNLDPSFAVDGQLQVAVDDGSVQNCDIQMSTDGDIVVAGTIESESSVSHAIFLRLDHLGQLDVGFGQDGVALVKQSFDVTVNSIGILPGGSILAGGALASSDQVEAGLLRLTLDGALDPSYGTDGQRIVTIEGAGSVINDILVEEDGTVLLVGAVDNGSYHQAFIGRVTDTGSYVSGFGESGLFRSSLEYENAANAIALQNDGTILVAGFAATETGKDVFLLTITETTAPEVSEQAFSAEVSALSVVKSAVPLEETESLQIPAVTGEEQLEGLTLSYALTDVSERDDVGYTVAILPDGNVVAAGSTENDSNMDFAVLRYSNDAIIQVSGQYAYGNAVVTEGFSILTVPVTNITRVSAVSGGSINDNSTLSCETGCKQECDISTDENIADIEDDSEKQECYDSCLEECESKPTIQLRGVVFSVTSLPSYNGEEVESDVEVDGETDSFIGKNSVYEGDLFSYDIIRSGQTEDGSGTGSYSSEMGTVSPDITYYVRAYAVLSDDMVIYGNQVMFRSDDACFIATAAYGSLMQKQVVLLREFRDTYLRGSSFGERVIGVYYHVSPRIAEAVAQNEILKALVRLVLLPFIFVAWFVLKAGSVLQLGLLVLLAGSAGLVLWVVKKNQVMSV